jgi:hypothetical protein
VFPSVVVTAENHGINNLVIYAGNAEFAGENQQSNFKIIQVNTAGSDIFTDAKNSADISSVSLLETYWKGLERNDLLFSN